MTPEELRKYRIEESRNRVLAMRGVKMEVEDPVPTKKKKRKQVARATRGGEIQGPDEPSGAE